jgi:glycosyltransferase involved in cell wall biosynthesis
MTFSVIIPTYNDWERLEKCVRSLIESSLNHGLEYEIIVVDNAESHHPPERVKKLDKIKWVHETTPGSYAARNSGAREAAGRYLAFTDSDCVPEEDWLINAGRVFKETGCDLIGGRIDLFRVENSSYFAYVYEKHTAFSQSKNVPKGHSVTANLIVKRNVFESLGGFNSGMKSGGDWEFTKRAVDSGYSLAYADDVRVQHPARASIGAIFKKQRRFAAWGYLNVKREYGHSGLRIMLSHFYRGIGSVLRISRKPYHLNEKGIVFLISTSLYFYRLALYMLIILKMMNPEQIRE